MADTVAVQVPQTLYHRLERLAELTHQPLQSLVVRALSSTIPPLPDDLPDDWRDALIGLEGLSDAELWRTLRAQFTDEQREEYARLREKQRRGTIAEVERAALGTLQQEADLLVLRKAYAGVLLKWRGHRLPTLDELKSPY